MSRHWDRWPTLYQPPAWGAPITKGWNILRWNPATRLYHGWTRTTGEFTVTPELVEARYQHMMERALRNGWVKNGGDSLQFHIQYYRYNSFRCAEYSGSIGMIGIVPHPYDADLETLLNLFRPGRAQVQAPIICDFCAMATEKGDDQELEAA